MKNILQIFYWEAQVFLFSNLRQYQLTGWIKNWSWKFFKMQTKRNISILSIWQAILFSHSFFFFTILIITFFPQKNGQIYQ